MLTAQELADRLDRPAEPPACRLADLLLSDAAYIEPIQALLNLPTKEAMTIFDEIGLPMTRYSTDKHRHGKCLSCRNAGL